VAEEGDGIFEVGGGQLVGHPRIVLRGGRKMK
jgi:hypothetical protein